MLTRDELEKLTFIENPNILVSVGTRIVKRRLIEISTILMGDLNVNVREGGADQTLIEDLKNSFSDGIKTTEFIPIVTRTAVHKQYDADGEVKQYELVDGFNRLNALKQLGYDWYWFDEVDFFETPQGDKQFARISLALLCNAHPPRKQSSNRDLFNALVHLVASGSLKNDKKEIKDYLTNVCRIRGGRNEKIADEVATHTGAPSSFRIWTAPMITHDTKSLGIVTDGKYDANRNMYGYTIGEGMSKRQYGRMLVQWSKTKKHCYYTSHVKTINSKTDLDARRHIEDEYHKELDKALFELHEHLNAGGEYPLHDFGFLPQDIDEDRHELVQLTKPKTLLDE